MSSPSLAPAIALREASRYDEAVAWLQQWLDQNPGDVAAMSLLAQVYFLTWAEAKAFEIVAKTQQLAPDAFHLLRNVSRCKARSGAPKEALDAALAAYDRSRDEETCLVLSSAWVTMGDDAAALRLIDEAFSLKPDYAEAFASRALIRARQGDMAAALADIKQAARLKPAMVPMQRLLAEFQLRTGNLSGAIDALRAAMRAAPADPLIVIELGALLAKTGGLAEAIAILEKAVALFPDRADAWTNYGVVLQGAKRNDEAAAAYRKGFEINPGSADLANNLGSLAFESGDWSLALSYLGKAVEIQPQRYEFLVNRANTLDKLQRLDESERDLRAALDAVSKSKAVSPSLGHPKLSDEPRRGTSSILGEAQGLLGSLLARRGMLAESEALLRASFANAPGRLDRIHQAELLLPKILPSHEAIGVARDRYRAGIANLRALAQTIDDPQTISTESFYLAYHGADDGPIMEELCGLYRLVAPKLTFVDPHIAAVRGDSKSRIRVGFCSQFFWNHTIGRLYHGHLAYLDRERFEIVLLHSAGAKRDHQSELLDSYADKVVRLSPGLGEQQRQIAAEQLDVLFYPDIGMSPPQYFLAFARLAPVQAVAWGHPDTTGIDTIDYFLSARLLEDERSQQKYSEQLVQFERLPCCYEPTITPTTIPSRAKMGLPLHGTLYGCPQSLFKFHPDFDSILADILTRDPSGHIIVIESGDSRWDEALRTRWAQRFPVVSERTVFLARQPLERFMGLMAHFDVLLDPVHFGSGNTLYEAMVYGTPIVTWPAQFMRGRIVAAAYRQMGIKGAPIASDFSDYARIAAELGTNEQLRRELRAEIVRGARANFFKDLRAVREFEDFLAASVEAARNGRKLPEDWRSSSGMEELQRQGCGSA